MTPIMVLLGATVPAYLLHPYMGDASFLIIAFGSLLAVLVARK